MIAASAPSRSRVNDSAISDLLSALWSKTIAARTPDVTKPANLEQLVFGILVRGGNTSKDKATADELQKGHLAYMDALHRQGKLVMAGPLGGNGPMRGLVVYRVKDVAEATALAADDPAVKAGTLALEAYPWMTFRGILK